jgi:N6-adenosine-specific RNA methylase IME4
MGTYRTIVADPPWQYRTTLPGFAADRTNRSAVPYGTMTVDEIAALPVKDAAAADAHLYLWTTNTHLEHAWNIVRAWVLQLFDVVGLVQAATGICRVPHIQLLP